MLYGVFAALAAVLLGLDQWFKAWIVANLPLGETMPFLPGIMQLRKGDFAAMAVAEGNANAILAANPDLAKAEFRFVVSDELTDNLILLKKGNDTLTEAVNGLLEKAESAGYYSEWYAEALQQAGIDITAPNQE